MQGPGVGGIKGIGVDGQIQTLDALIDFIAQAIWRATSYHAVINYSVYDAMGVMPNMPMAQYAPPPRHREHPWEDFLAMLPPRMEMYRQFDDVFVVSSVRYNRLGEYELGYFADRRVRPIVDSFQQDLQQIEFDIRERNRWDRRAPYEILVPSNVTGCPWRTTPAGPSPARGSCTWACRRQTRLGSWRRRRPDPGPGSWRCRSPGP